MRKFKPESLMMTQSKEVLKQTPIKIPLYQASTYQFETAEEGKAIFDSAYGISTIKPGENAALFYSRIDHPNLQLAESKLCLWEEAEACLLFDSGMAAISSALMSFLKPGDTILHSTPLYGGTDRFIHRDLKKWQIKSIGYRPEDSEEQILKRISDSGLKESISIVYVETPANPTNDLFDISLARRIADQLSTKEKRVVVMADNTYMGPVWQKPLQHGADLVLYSATKYIGGHSDLVAGACLGSNEWISEIRKWRSITGNAASPFTAWLLTRSLETLKIRMDRHSSNAIKIGAYLSEHPKIGKLFYPPMLDKGDQGFEIYQKQCLAPGAMISFEIVGGQPSAFRFLNNLKLAHMAVSLGGTETLVSHPATMIHADVPEADKQRFGITPGLIRLSVGIEDPDDLIWDFEQALSFA